MPVFENNVLQGKWLSYDICPQSGYAPPGFWNRGSYADLALDRLYTITLLTDTGQPAHLVPAYTRMDDRVVTTMYTVDSLAGVRVQESRYVTATDTLISVISLNNVGSSPVSLDIIVRTLLTNSPGSSFDEVALTSDIASWKLTTDRAADDEQFLTPNHLDSGSLGAKAYSLWAAMGASRLPDSRVKVLSENWPDASDWVPSPLSECFTGRKFQYPPLASSTESSSNLAHIGLHFNVEALAGEGDSIAVGICLTADTELSMSQLRDDLAGAVRGINTGAEDITALTALRIRSSDPRFEKLYTQQLNTVDKLTIQQNITQPPSPFVITTLNGRRCIASAHMSNIISELIALNAVPEATATLLTLLEHQEPDGRIPALVTQFRGNVGNMHWNAGGALMSLISAGTQPEVLRRVYTSLSRYASFLNLGFRSQATALYRPVSSSDDGMSCTGRALSHYTVGATVQCYTLIRSLAAAAARLGASADRREWSTLADATAQSVQKFMWSNDYNFFTDFDEETMQQSPLLFADGFAPLGTDIATVDYGAAWQHLANNHTFGAPFGVPSAARSNSSFSGEGLWQGAKRRVSWNGPAWARQNVSIFNSLLYYTQHVDSGNEAAAVQMFERLVATCAGRTTYSRFPSCWNPLAGTMNASCGGETVGDWPITNLMLATLAGVGHTDEHDKVTVTPLPVEIDWFIAENIVRLGQKITIIWEQKEGFRILVNKREVHSSTHRMKVTFNL